MTFLAAWLLGIGAADLARPGGALPRGRRGAAVLLAAGVVVGSWCLLGGRVDAPRLAVLLALAACAVGWVLVSARAVARGLTTPLAVTAHDVLTLPVAAGPPRSQPVAGRPLRVASLLLLAVGTAVALAANGLTTPAAGPLARWYAGLRLASLRGVDLPRAAVLLGVLLAQVGTANVVVRLGLDAAGARSEPGVLRGGRILGPLERLFVVGLGLAGQPTAASIVVAAKGLLRFPELSKQGTAGQRIDAVTEYFLVGSFVSWLVALLGIVLVRA